MARIENWDLVGGNIRQTRALRGLTQRQLAERAGVTLSTVYHAESGRPLMRRTLERICGGLDCPLNVLFEPQKRLLADGVEILVHRSEEALWVAAGERRSKVPEDDVSRIQSPEERLRLGRLGLVPLFLCYLRFIMPEGPGPVHLELYGRFEEALNQTLYRDSVLMCVEGVAHVHVAGRTVALKSGDALGYQSGDLRWMEPKGTALPTRLTWVGAVRHGRLPRG